MSQKTGANFQDRNAIERLENQGYDSREISVSLNIREDVIRNFMKSPDGVEPLPEGVHINDDGYLVNEEGQMVEVEEDGSVTPIE